MKKIELNNESLLEMYFNGQKTKDIAERLRVSLPTVHRRLKELKTTRRNQGGQRKYNVNHHYFDVIDCEEKAYWLGFLLADGCIRTNSNMLSVNLSSVDKGHLAKFQDALKSDYPFYEQPNQGTHGMSCLSITSTHLTNKLRAKGIIANNKKIFCVKPKLLNHFWRGCVDGDGCLGFTVSKHGTPQIRLSLIGTLETIQQFRDFCVKLTDTKAKIEYKKGTPYFRLHGPKVMVVLDALYQGANIYLDRKMQRYRVLNFVC